MAVYPRGKFATVEQLQLSIVEEWQNGLSSL